MQPAMCREDERTAGQHQIMESGRKQRQMAHAQMGSQTLEMDSKIKSTFVTTFSRIQEFQYFWNLHTTDTKIAKMEHSTIGTISECHAIYVLSIDLYISVIVKI